MKLGRHSYSRTENIKICDIGNFTAIGVNCTFGHGGNHPSRTNRKLVSNYAFCETNWDSQYPGCEELKGIYIGNDVWIGESVTVLNGITIGDGAIIGAHSVIAKDIPAYAVVVGNPGIIKRFRFSEEIIKKMLSIGWWNWDDEKIKQALPDFLDIDKFIQKYG